jgi:thiol-disulfide isomerase/thioredoxin
MGFDEVFVHLAVKYYLSNDAYWADSTLKAKIEERVKKIEPNLLHKRAYNLQMQDSNYVTHDLDSVKAKYTVVVFWDPTCSHCKVEIPKLVALYDSIKSNGVEVYAVGIESDLNEWKKFIREKKLDWLNVTDMYNKTKFRDYYDIYSTPVIFLLDENKKFIAKRLDVETLRNFLKHLIQEDKEKGKKK